MPQADAPTGDKRLTRSRATVLEAGVELLIEGGPNAVTVDAVVQRSGVAKTTVYRQWNSRDELVVDVIRAVIRPAPAPPADMPFEPALRAMMRTRCANAGDHRTQRAFPALLLSRAQRQPELEQLRDETELEQRALLESILERGVAEGQLAEDVQLDDALLQLMAPLILITCDLHDFDDDVADRIVDLFLASHRPT